ncbi:Integrase catalytic subunit [Clostridium pasteurianum DSM 525 = ATCC 6013]|uniref:IS21 family transposase n=1 Tax=Clostridium pasteurianum TaxID=1501 RepID=UPI0002A74C65|nr:IS21 family transposase [Clostridium pasteurianum]ELP57689.1 Integrase catalytic subunit [Clostridium pasteurianum DSM 525 = ATCC 6013]
MIDLNQKQDIILKHIREGKSQRQISKETGICRETIRKYVRDYENKLIEVNDDLGEIDKINIINDITSKPKYISSPRVKKALTDEVIERLKQFLRENEQKRLSGLSKQQKKKIDMYEVLLEEGYNISYPSVVNAVNSIERKKREAYIRQEYSPGDIVEFDFGVVKLQMNDGTIKEFQLAVFTAAYSNYRWARLFPKQNTGCFLEAHASFFKHIKGNHRTVVYDNTRVAVGKFVGHTEKEPTDALLKLSLYYKFRFRFCNAYSGNEKGHVERSVEFIRRKAFSREHTFISLNEANAYLDEVLNKLNSRTLSNSNKSPFQLLDDEREYLLPDMPLYETASISDLRVNKYSTIMVDSCYYSVPDDYVGTMVRCKIYTTKILVFYNEKEIATHDKVYGMNLWHIDIMHYAKTLFRKPKALINSTAFNQMDNMLKEIYSKYFNSNDRDFVKLIELVGNYGLVTVNNAIKNLQEVCPTNISIDKIEFICSRKDDPKIIYLEDHDDEIMNNSLNILNEFNSLLKQ